MIITVIIMTYYLSNVHLWKILPLFFHSAPTTVQIFFCLFMKLLPVPNRFDVVLILVTFPNVAYLDVLEMTGKLTGVLQKKINYVAEN